MSAKTEEKAPVLTDTDRCDRCGSRAYSRVFLKTGGVLMFCGHHWRSLQDNLRPLADHIDDETKTINVEK